MILKEVIFSKDIPDDVFEKWCKGIKRFLVSKSKTKEEKRVLLSFKSDKQFHKFLLHYAPKGMELIVSKFY